MATEATTWLPLERMKDELRIPPHVTDKDVTITGHIEAAVAFIETEIGIPLLEQTEIRPILGSGGNVPLHIGFVSHLQSVPRIDYWNNADKWHPPDATLEHLFETRALFGSDPKSWKKPYLLLPPPSGFPVSSNRRYHVTIQSGMDSTKHPNIRQVLIALAREFYSGSPQVRTIFSRPMFERLLEPLHQYGVSDYGAYANR